MSKIKIVSLLALVVISVGLLTGCGAEPIAPASVENVLQEETPIAPVATSTEPELDLDAETQGLDATLNEIDKSGFEQTDLSDKDLGL
jgi:hypothetical protein